MEKEITVFELFNIFKKRFVLIMNMTIIGLVLAAGYTFFVATPQYSATSQLLVNRSQETEVIQRSDIDTNVQLINTYSDIIRNPIILEPVIEEIGMEQSTGQLRNKISVTTSENSQVFSLQVTDDNPYEAAEIANTTSNVFRDNLNSIMNVDNVTIISEAVADTNPVSPNNTLNMVIGIFVGGMLGVAVAFTLEILDTTVKEDKFIVDELGWNNLGAISRMSTDELNSDSDNISRKTKTENRTSRSRV
ncbi:Wzz/FepE/Etk N-terminal domain-containing protein [Marinilactibacillus sp. XAAS-LB27]|uniref:YveK family protein n=1 Tax=Marinilactibacillus sp. XAAS-LB27 TaxID=3114538 RepID=UPI002E19792B|nr:Wzz/FepE/Etk N-terminal domain-containing protein [Marinilactibacillus sp. XAAS-LB27]